MLRKYYRPCLTVGRLSSSPSALEPESQQALVNTRRLKNGISGNRHFVAWIDFTASGSGVVWARGKPANSK
jgi:hypothetical protein